MFRFLPRLTAVSALTAAHEAFRSAGDIGIALHRIDVEQGIPIAKTYGYDGIEYVLEEGFEVR